MAGAKTPSPLQPYRERVLKCLRAILEDAAKCAVMPNGIR